MFTGVITLGLGQWQFTRWYGVYAWFGFSTEVLCAPLGWASWRGELWCLVGMEVAEVLAHGFLVAGVRLIT